MCFLNFVLIVAPPPPGCASASYTIFSTLQHVHSSNSKCHTQRSNYRRRFAGDVTRHSNITHSAFEFDKQPPDGRRRQYPELRLTDMEGTQLHFKQYCKLSYPAKATVIHGLIVIQEARRTVTLTTSRRTKARHLAETGER